MPGKKKFYAYRTVHEEGVTDSWPRCKAIVEQERGARYKGFATRTDAEKWLGEGAVYERKASRKALEKSELDGKAIYFDSGTGGKRGVEVNVTDKEGTPLLFMVVPPHRLNEKGTMILERDRTNNFGELAALYLAIMVANKMRRSLVCGDSRLVIDYWSKGFVSKKKTADRDLMVLVEKAVAMRKEFEARGGSVEHVKGSLNPADMGFHRD